MKQDGFQVGKKYKLVKSYPASPPIGTILTPNSFGNATYEGTWLYKIDSSPEFWEEVIEKRYEILSYIGDVTRTLYTLTKDGNYENSAVSHKFKPEFFLFKTDSYKIHSIKRLSDGEIFTVGDRIISYKTEKNIKAINIPVNRLGEIGFVTKLDNISSTGYQYLFADNIQKVKKPLFTTADGVDIYVGTVHYSVDKDFKVKQFTAELSTLPAANIEWCLADFSTKEAAEEYVINYKPCLSLLDIEGYLINNHQLTSVKKLIQTRL